MANPNFPFLLLPLALFLLLLFFIVCPHPTTIPITNRHVFITGCSSGIGLTLAHRASSEGSKVSILGRSFDKLEESKNYIQLSTCINVTVFAADVRDYEAVSKGVFVTEELEKHGLDEVRFMVDVNLMGSFNMINATLPRMKDRMDRGPGSIALMSSQVGQIVDNIHISLIFPPTTDTPGLTKDVHSIAEAKKRPQLTRIITKSSSVMKAEEVAKKALDGIKSASFIVPCNFEGLLLSIGEIIQYESVCKFVSFVMAFVEVVAAGIICIVALGCQWNWYTSIHKWHGQNKSFDA
ncbi:putative 3-dehydrosphinganine reductase [Rosa chinensis]|uniref:Putative 3-dehydrosphinganine reductase n=1 Tax=Rosa chinensis TaxID=74649 RepID=A0A2P6PRB5_ROSCH|nr:putative 3-dehydrosphinganine reductase [Rosa chinensis]